MESSPKIATQAQKPKDKAPKYDSTRIPPAVNGSKRKTFPQIPKKMRFLGSVPRYFMKIGTRFVLNEIHNKRLIGHWS